MRVIYAFPTPTFIENIVVRPNGHILITTFREGSVFGIDPNAQTPEPYLVAKLPGIETLTGIVQMEPDLYCVTGGISPRPMWFTKGTLKAFTVDLRNGLGANIVGEAVSADDAQLLNGMANLPENPYICLSLDSIEGKIVRIDMKARKVDTVLQDQLLMPSENPKKVPLGANGAKMRDGYLYFTNSGQELFCRVKVNAQGDVIGGVEVLTRNDGASIDMPYDDFDFGHDGCAYVGKHPDAIYCIDLDGRQRVFAGGDAGDIIQSPTCVAISRDGSKAYVGAAGKLGEFCGKIVELDISTA